MVGAMNNSQRRPRRLHSSLTQFGDGPARDKQGMDTKAKRRPTFPPFACIKDSSFTSDTNMDRLSTNDDITTTKAERRRSSVTFAPLPPSVKPHSDTLTHERKHNAGPASKGFRSDYSIGDVARSRSHMVVNHTFEQAFQAVNSLKKHDFAFIKRSDGSFSYSILAFRSLEPSDDGRISPTDSLDEYMAFVVSGAGSIKMLKKEQWNDYVRLVSMEDIDHLQTKTRSAKRKHGMSLKNDHKDEWVPPSIISFVSASSLDDDDTSRFDPNSW